MNKDTKILTIGLLDKNDREKGFLKYFFGKGIYDFIVREGGLRFLYCVEEKKLQNIFKKPRDYGSNFIKVTKIDKNSIHLENNTIIELCSLEMDELMNKLEIWYDRYYKERRRV